MNGYYAELANSMARLGGSYLMASCPRHILTIRNVPLSRRPLRIMAWWPHSYNFRLCGATRNRIGVSADANE